MPAVSLLKLASRCPGSIQTSSLAFETSTPQIVFFTVTCLVHAIGTQATVRSCVTWRRSQSSPTVVAGGGTGDIATRFGRWPPAKALSRFHRTNSGRADTRGTLRELSAWRLPLTPTLSPQAGRGSAHRLRGAIQLDLIGLPAATRPVSLAVSSQPASWRPSARRRAAASGRLESHARPAGTACAPDAGSSPPFVPEYSRRSLRWWRDPAERGGRRCPGRCATAAATPCPHGSIRARTASPGRDARRPRRGSARPAADRPFAASPASARRRCPAPPCRAR